MKRNALFLTAALLCTLLLPGCSVYEATKEGAKSTYNFMFDRDPRSEPAFQEDDTPIIEINHNAADKLFYNVNKHHELPANSPIYVRSFTNEDNQEDKAKFGRIVANQVATRLAQHDMLITDGAPRPLPKTVAVPNAMNNATDDGSWFSSTRKEAPPRPAMLTGTYYIGDTVIYMNSKIIRLDDDAVISSASWTLPINDNVRELLPQLKRPGGIDPAVRDKF